MFSTNEKTASSSHQLSILSILLHHLVPQDGLDTRWVNYHWVIEPCTSTVGTQREWYLSQPRNIIFIFQFRAICVIMLHEAWIFHWTHFLHGTFCSVPRCTIKECCLCCLDWHFIYLKDETPDSGRIYEEWLQGKRSTYRQSGTLFQTPKWRLCVEQKGFLRAVILKYPHSIPLTARAFPTNAETLSADNS